MTTKEALKIVGEFVQDERIDSIEKFNALIVSMAALEKHIPKKPLLENKYYGVGECPSCGAVFVDKELLTPYCGNCGQALDWGEQNEK